MIRRINDQLRAIASVYETLKYERGRLERTLKDIEAEMLRVEGEVRVLERIAGEFVKEAEARQRDGE